MVQKAYKNTKTHQQFNMKIFNNYENKGVSYTLNKGWDNATGEYVVLLGSDDWFVTSEFIKVMNQLNGEDLVYFNLEINNGTIFRLTDETKFNYCSSVKFMKRSFVGNLRNCEQKRVGEDMLFFQELQDKNPIEKFTNITAKRYDFPRENSLSDLKAKGAFKKDEL